MMIMEVFANHMGSGDTQQSRLFYQEAAPREWTTVVKDLLQKLRIGQFV